jgi:anti-anti-sigma factor
LVKVKFYSIFLAKAQDLFNLFIPNLEDRKMEINQKEESGIVTISIKGRMDADTAPEAEKTVNSILKGDSNRLLFDLEQLEYLSSAGLRVLLSAAKELKRREGKIVLCSLNEFVKEIFEVSGFESLIPISDSVESGKKVLS